jgi:hypothetical protein
LQNDLRMGMCLLVQNASDLVIIIVNNNDT